MNDLRFAFRQLLKHPAGTAIILVTLALVIGTMSLVLGVIQHERSRWMPFPDPHQLVRLWRVNKDRPREEFPAAVYTEAARAIQGLASIAAIGGSSTEILTGEGEPRSLAVESVTASAFDVGGFQPILGRVFTSQEEDSGNEQLIVLSHDAWHSVFAGEESVIGKVIRLNNLPCTVIGVMPLAFEHNALFYGIDVWKPLNLGSPSRARTWIRIVGRRKQEVPASALNAEVQAVLPHILAVHAASVGWETDDASATTLPLDKRPGNKNAAELITGVTIPAFVLAIAAFNIANILLGRMLTRRHEFAVRFSLGARRARVIRQLLTESVLLSFIGASFGLLGAIWISRVAAANGINSEFSPAVLGLTVIAAAVIGIAVGWLPAMRSTRGGLATDLKEFGGAGAVGGTGRHRLRNFLVMGQVAMATSLCISAGLLVRGYLRKQQFDPGFDASQFISVYATLNREVYDQPDERLIYREQALERLRNLPGVEDAAFSSDRTVDRYPFPTGFFLEGQRTWQQGQRVSVTIVSPNYFEMIDVPVLNGRGLGETDRRGAPGVALVNQAFVARYFPNEDPIGKRIGVHLETERDWLAIVGIIPDRPNLGNKSDIGPEAYLCAKQFAPEWSSNLFVARTQPNPIVLRDMYRNAVVSVDRSVPVGNPITLDSRIERAVQRNISGTQAIGAIGLFGLAMAIVGIYGVIGYSVTERTRELGIRMALGADRKDTLGMIVRQGMRYVLTGLGVGLTLAAATTFGMEDLLYGTHPLDPPTYTTVGSIVLLSALAAILLPASRAVHIKPMEALRYE